MAEVKTPELVEAPVDAAPVEAAPPPPAPAEPQVFALDILSLIKKAQLQNGLRHGDYLRYKSYCTRRAHRIRKKLGFLHAKKFKKLEIVAEKINDVRYLELVLIEAERCWAHAMQLKEEAENPRAKFHAKRRLAKGALHATKLLELCNARADAKTKLEAESYSAWFTGSSLLEKEEWAEAKTHLIRAKTVYQEMGKVGDPTHQELCRERVSEIEPSIRLCNFSISQELDPATLRKMMAATEEEANPALDLLRSKLDHVMSDLRKKEAASINEIKWKGKVFPLKNESLRLSIVSANDLTLELEQAVHQELKIQLFDKIFIQYSDALKFIDNDINTAKKTTQGKKKAEEDIKILEALREYVEFANVGKTMERNAMMADNLVAKLEDFDNGKLSAKTKPPSADEIARLFEFLVKNVDKALEFIAAEELEKTKVYGAKRFSYQALHCFYMALSYEAAEKFREAVALLGRTEEHLKNAVSHWEACKEVDQEALARMKKLAKTVLGRRSLILARNAQGNKKDAAAESRGLLLETPNDFVPAQKLFEFPPKFESFPIKPLFLDVATEGLDGFPDLADRTRPPRPIPKAEPAPSSTTAAAAAKPATTTGGFFSSLWGSKK